MQLIRNAYFERILVPNSSGAQIVSGKPGILCVLVEETDGVPPLLLLRDERHLNEGASITSVVEHVVRYLKHRLAGCADLTRVNIVEHDSSGHYEHIHLSWTRGNPSCVDWSPVRWVGTRPKSEAAFKGVFGLQANTALEVLSCLGLQEQS